MKSTDCRESWLTLYLFGTFEARLGDGPLPRLRSRKEQWLLALLALRAGAAVDREWLAGTLWPDSSSSQALAYLRKSLSQLRYGLGREALRLSAPTPRTVRLDLAGAEVDVVAFDAAITRGETDTLERAVALYRGPLLEGCVEAWALSERDAREQAFLAALETLATRAAAAGEFTVAERHLRRAITVDPLRESAHRSLMQTLAGSGSYAAAIEVYRELRAYLHREINAEPDPETQAVYAQIRADARGKAGGATGRRGDGVKEGDLPSRPVSLSSRLPAASLPEGTLTFLFTDLEGSTRLWEERPEAMSLALARHDALLREAIEGHGGVVFKRVGDQFCAAFTEAPDALRAAFAAQRAVLCEEWAGIGTLRVRVVLHTGSAEQRDGDYFGPPLNRAARLLDAAHGCQVLFSLATAELVREALPEEASLRDLGTHRLRDLQQPERIFQLLHPALPAMFPPPRSLESFAHNLPRPLTSFIGRDRELTELRALLRSGPAGEAPPLLTLIGTGGCGKTRLALQAAADLIPEYRDGIWLVELAGQTDPALVPQAVATVLGLREEPHRSVTTLLTEYLAQKALLLILDNCEHLVAACAELAQSLLRECRRLRILATSREVLGVPGEKPYRVPSLSLPEPEQITRRGAAEPENVVAALTEYEAPRLFIERARTSQPGFTPTAASAPAVAEICHRLDGIPLAIELAAARVKLLPVEQIAARLDDRFRLLTGGSRTALPRHQALRAAVDWSYELLSDAERVLLRRLSVFAGGFTLAAAEAVCGEAALGASCLAPGEGDRSLPSAKCQAPSADVLDLLGQLVDKSLVVPEPQDGETRYRLLETIRQYGLEKLHESNESAAIRDRHRDWYVALAEQAEPELRGPEQSVWLDLLEREHDNFRAVLDAMTPSSRNPTAPLCDGPSVDAALRVGAALWRFWEVRGHLAEGRARLTAALERAGRLHDTPAHAGALAGAGVLANAQGEYAAARAYLDESLSLWRTLERGKGDGRGRPGGATRGPTFGLPSARQGTAVTLNLLGALAIDEKAYDEAGRYLEEALSLLDDCHHTGRGNVIHNLALLAARRGRFEEARSLYEEALRHRREAGDRRGEAESLGNLGVIAHHLGERVEARRFYLESLSHRELLGDRYGIAVILNNLGELAEMDGDVDTAIAFFVHSERILHDLQSATATVPAQALQRLLEPADPRRQAALEAARQRTWQEIVNRYRS